MPPILTPEREEEEALEAPVSPPPPTPPLDIFLPNARRVNPGWTDNALRNKWIELYAPERDQFISDSQPYNPSFSREQIGVEYDRIFTPSHDAPAPIQPPPDDPGLLGSAQDLAIKGAQGVVGFGESVVGFGDIVTGGKAGDIVSDIGVDFEAIHANLGQYLSDAQTHADQTVHDADGFFNTLWAGIQNPRAISGYIAQAIPGTAAMLAIPWAMSARIAANAAKGLGSEEGVLAGQAAVKAAYTRLLMAGAATEGAQATGSTAEQSRAAGRAWSEYVLPSLGAGIGTAAIGVAGGKLAGDVFTSLATKGQAGSIAGGRATRIGIAGLTEGTEETLQSGQEQMFSNLAMGKPWDEGIEDAAAIGLLTGSPMGAGTAAVSPGPSRDPAGVPTETPSIKDTPTEKIPDALGTLDPSVDLDEALTRSEELLGDAFVAQFKEEAAIIEPSVPQTGIEAERAKPDAMRAPETVAPPPTELPPVETPPPVPPVTKQGRIRKEKARLSTSTEPDAILDRIRNDAPPSPRATRGPTLIDMLRERGGLQTSGELTSMDVDAGRTPFQRNLLQDDGMSLDQAAELAQQEGFLQERDIPALVESIENELAGRPLHAPQNENARMVAVEQAMEEMRATLEELNIDVQTSSNADIAATLRTIRPRVENFEDLMPAGEAEQLREKIPPNRDREPAPIEASAEVPEKVSPTSPSVAQGKQPWEIGRREAMTTTGNLFHSRFKPLIKVDDSPIASPKQKRDADKLFNAIDEGDVATVDKIAKRYFYSAFVKGISGGAGPIQKEQPSSIDVRIGKQAALGHQLLEKHKNTIKQALSNGKPVPKEVLADYPDLVSAVTPAKEAQSDEPDTQRVPVSKQQEAKPGDRDVLGVEKGAGDKRPTEGDAAQAALVDAQTDAIKEQTKAIKAQTAASKEMAASMAKIAERQETPTPDSETKATKAETIPPTTETKAPSGETETGIDDTVSLKPLAPEPQELYDIAASAGVAQPLPAHVNDGYGIQADVSDIPVATRESIRVTIREALEQLDRNVGKGETNAFEHFATEIDLLHARLEKKRDEKRGRSAPRVRGAGIIKEKIALAERRGTISEEHADLARWFLKGNEHLFDDLGISIRKPSDRSASGAYDPLRRIMTIVKGTTSETTAVHEMLHHLERLMPQEHQEAIRTEWLRQVASLSVRTTDQNVKDYLEAVVVAHLSGKKSDREQANEFISRGKVPYSFYSLMNPSEFWAVKGVDVIASRAQSGVWGRIKQWLTEAIERMKGALGLRSDTPILKALKQLQTEATGKRESLDMLSQADTYADVAPPRKTPVHGTPLSQGKPEYILPELGPLDTVRRMFVDRSVDTRVMVDEVLLMGGSIPDDLNPIYADEVHMSRVADSVKLFGVDELLPMLDAMEARKVEPGTVHSVAHARHATQANAYLKDINERFVPDDPTQQDVFKDDRDISKLSGMSDKEAGNILAATDMKAMQPILDKMDAIMAETNRLKVAYGLETQKTIDGWNAQYDHYIPLRREGFDERRSRGGKDVRGSTTKQRLGSERDVLPVLSQIVQDRITTITRGEENRVRQAFAGFLTVAPQPSVAKLAKLTPITYTDPDTGLLVTIPGGVGGHAIPMKRYLDKKTGKVESRPKPNYKGDDYVVNFRVNGKDFAIVFNENNERATKIAEAMNGLDTKELNTVLATIAPVTRFLAAVNTQYSPIFGVVNLLRDVPFAMLTLMTTELKGKRVEILKGVPAMMRGIYIDARAFREGKHPPSKNAKLWEIARKAGMPTGYSEMFRMPGQETKEIEHLMDPDWWQKHPLGKMITVGGLAAKPTSWLVNKPLKALFNWLSDYNLMMENGIRLSVFEVATRPVKDGGLGLSPIRGASLAKNSTVNFNRKGTIGIQMGAAYVFFNAAAQGSAQVARTLLTFKPGKGRQFSDVRLSRTGKRIIAGGVGLGAMQAVALMLAGIDDDDIPEFIKARNLIIPHFNDAKTYSMYPYPLGFNWIPNVGRLAVEAVATGKPATKAWDFATDAFDIFSPVGGATSAIQFIAPSVADPFVALSENKDWTGRTISKDDYSTLAPTPGHTRVKGTATPWAMAMSRAINFATGGTEYTPSSVITSPIASPTPDQIDYLISQVTGGVGREITKGVKSITGAVTGQDVPLYQIPLVGRFFGSAKGDATIRSRFYLNIGELNKHAAEIKGMRQARDFKGIETYKATHPTARDVERGKLAYSSVQRLIKERRALTDAGAPRERVKLKEARITAKQRELNDRLKRRGVPSKDTRRAAR